jgi:hypothetical protein
MSVCFQDLTWLLNLDATYSGLVRGWRLSKMTGTARAKNLRISAKRLRRQREPLLRGRPQSVEEAGGAAIFLLGRTQLAE